jgi:thioredoxin reductase (NADPH)
LIRRFWRETHDRDPRNWRSPFVRTGSDLHPTGRPLLPLETGVDGVFAEGDVRCGSVKRVGGAIGEGTAVVAQLHSFLARQNP